MHSFVKDFENWAKLLESVCLEGTVVSEEGRGNQEELLERNLHETTFYCECNNLISDFYSRDASSIKCE